MKYRILIFFAINLFAISLFAQDCISPVNITTNDTSAVIFVDKKYSGKGETKLDLSEGLHIVSIRQSLVKWNGYEINDTLKILVCPKEYSFNYKILENIYVDSRPQNAGILQNDSLVGYTPLFVNGLNVNSIKFKKDGLLTDADFKMLKSGKIPEINFKPVTVSENFTDSDLFKILVGTTAVLGATAAYFKLRADNKYDDYLINKNNSTLDEVDRLDLISGIAFGLLQINFGYLVYRFIAD